MREALFDILAHGQSPLPNGERVVECFAGTGALGFEALSRGAAWVTFLDNRFTARRLIRQNAQLMGVANRVTILDGDALRPPRSPAPCGLALLDPPYGAHLAPKALSALADRGWLTIDGVAAVEISAKEEFSAPGGYSLLTVRDYGSARLVFLTWRGDTEDP